MKTNYFILYQDLPDGRRKIKFSQPKGRWNKVWSFSLITEEIQEVVMRMWTCENRLIHSIAEWDESKVYIQAVTIFEARRKFKQFIDEHLKNENQKQKAAI